MDKIDVILFIGYILSAGAALAAIVLPLINAMSNPSSLLKIGVGVFALLLVFGVGYLVAGSEVTAIYKKLGVDAGLSKFIGGGMTMTYLLFILSIVGILYTEVTKAVK